MRTKKKLRKMIVIVMVMNMASDLMCPSPTTLSSSSFLSTSTPSKHTPMRGHGRPVRGKNQIIEEERDGRVVGEEGLGRGHVIGGGDIKGGGKGNVVGGVGGGGDVVEGGEGPGRGHVIGGGDVIGREGGDVGGGGGVVKEAGHCGGRGHDSGRVQSSRGDGNSVAPTSLWKYSRNE